jgi:polysaccharide pyruvyl transferase WcaK-like protein
MLPALPISSTVPWSFRLYSARGKVVKLLIMQISQPRIVSTLLDQNILLNTLFSNTLSLCSSLNVRDQVSHPYKSTCKIIMLYTFLL